MKIIRVLILISLILTGCGEKDNRVFRWKPADRECDEMIFRIDSAWASGEPSFMTELRLDTLDSLTSMKGVSRQSRGRYHYWRARVSKDANESALFREDSIARSYMDSASYPYDHARLNAIKHSVYCPDFINRYNLLLSSMRYAESTGDDCLLAETMVILSEYGWNYSNDLQSVSLLRRADSLFRKIGLAHRADVASLNLSLVTGDSVRLLRGLDRLVGRRREYGATDVSVSVNEILLYIMKDDLDGLVRAYDDTLISAGMKSWILSSMSNIYHKKGMADKVDSLVAVSLPLLDKAISEGETGGDVQFYSAVYPMLIDCVRMYENRRMYDSSYYYLQKAVAVNSEYERYHGIVQSRDITKAWMEEALMKQEELNRRDRTVTALWWSLSLCGLVAVLFAVWFIM